MEGASRDSTVQKLLKASLSVLPVAGVHRSDQVSSAAEDVGHREREGKNKARNMKPGTRILTTDVTFKLVP